jgi:CheY-like chemotaxis protein
MGSPAKAAGGMDLHVAKPIEAAKLFAALEVALTSPEEQQAATG